MQRQMNLCLFSKTLTFTINHYPYDQAVVGLRGSLILKEAKQCRFTCCK